MAGRAPLSVPAGVMCEKIRQVSRSCPEQFPAYLSAVFSLMMNTPRWHGVVAFSSLWYSGGQVFFLKIRAMFHASGKFPTVSGAYRCRIRNAFRGNHKMRRAAAFMEGRKRNNQRIPTITYKFPQNFL